MTSITRFHRCLRFLFPTLSVLALTACATFVSSTGFNIHDLPTRAEIANRLAQGSLPGELRQQIARLYSRDPTVRARAAAHLANMGEDAAPAVPYLVQFLADDTPVQLSTYLGGGYTSSLETTPGEQASYALAEIGNQASSALILALSDHRPIVRRLAAKALGQIGDVSSVDVLVNLLNDPNSGVEATAAIALGNYRHPMAVEEMIKRYPKASVSARTDMIYAMGNINDIIAVPFLIKQAADPHPSIRAAVMLALGKLGDARAIPALLKGIKDQDEMTRINAAYSLGNYYSPDVVTALVNSLKDPASGVRAAAVSSLKGLSGVDFGNSYEKWRKWWQKQRSRMQSPS